MTAKPQYPWRFNTAGNVIYGRDALQSLCAEVCRLNGKRPLIVTDPGVASSGALKNVTSLLDAGRVEYAVFDRVKPEPPVSCVAEALDVLKAQGHDLIIGVGGGSAMDVAKVVSVAAADQADIRSYFGVDLIPRAGLPKILIPTTAGTGSEVTAAAILTDTEEHVKKALISRHLYAESAIVDPEMSKTMPRDVTAATGMDALVHAVEALVSVKANPVGNALAIRAIGMISQWLPKAFDDGGDMDARNAMAIAAMMAGMAFANSSVAMVHALAYPVGARFGIPHGVANAILLPPVTAFIAPACKQQLALVAEAMGENELSSRSALRAMVRLGKRVRVPMRLEEFGVTKADIPALSEAAARIERLLDLSPRRPTTADIAAVYTAALGIGP